MDYQVFDEIRYIFTNIQTVVKSVHLNKRQGYLTYSSSIHSLVTNVEMHAEKLKDLASNKLICDYIASVEKNKVVLGQIEARLNNVSLKFNKLFNTGRLELIEITMFTIQLKCISNMGFIQENFLVAFEARCTTILRPVKAKFVLLEQIFATNTHPSLEVKKSLSKKTGLTIDQINNWFTVHRYRQRKKRQEFTERQFLKYLEF